MQKQIAKVEALIEDLLTEQMKLAAHVHRLDETTGVGRVTAVMRKLIVLMITRSKTRSAPLRNKHCCWAVLPRPLRGDG